MQPLNIAIWGSTGATGGELLRQCLDDPRIAEVRVFNRRPLPTVGSRVKQVIIEDFVDSSGFSDYLRGIDAVFWCLGVSQSAVPDERLYREITCTYALAAAGALLEESPEGMFHFLSGMGADRSGRSSMMWARVKGEAETHLSNLGLQRLVVWRPAYIHAVRGREKPSLLDRVWMRLFPFLRLFPNATNTTVDIAPGNAASDLCRSRGRQPSEARPSRD